jgi:hypothetical protein
VSGAVLRGGSVAPEGPVIRMTLHLQGSASIVVDADLVRHIQQDEFGLALAVAFRGLTARQEDVIQDAILKAVEALNGPKSAVRPQFADDDAADVGIRAKQSK